MSERDDRSAAPASLQVVATAGHVDHGKSSLIRRITGLDPDRLEEEKRRGLTIDLGFAWCELPSGREVGFVDVPGHERFVRTMLAGVGPVRLVLFVVAADEGWRRQSEEHLAIVDVLGVEGAVVAITKRDLVEADRLAAAEREVHERLRGTSLERAVAIPCSSVTGEGVDELLAALDDLVAGAPEPTTDGRLRLFVDRVFTISGAGTVVTGTLTGGPLTVGDEIELLPNAIRGRARGLQTHKRKIEAARPVSRVAVNVAGVDRARVERGDVLVRPGEWRPTSLLEARLHPVRGLAHAVTARGAFTLHAGAAERGATVRLYDASALDPGGAFARIRLSAPLVLDVHDRFVLRDAGRRETVAGGVVLDPSPPRRPGPEAATRLEQRERATGAELPALLLAERGALLDDEVRLLAGTSEIGGGRRVGRWWVAEPVHRAVEAAALELVGRHHRDHPSAEGVDASEVELAMASTLRAAGAPPSRDLTIALLEELVGAGSFARSGRAVRLATHAAEAAGEDLELVVREIAAREPTPPTIPELVTAGHSREAIDRAVRSGALVRIAPELVLSSDFVARAIEAVREAGARGISVSALRQALGTSRKYAVPLMEHLDRTGATRRSGDLRFARGV